MKRVHVICHMVTSLDGRVTGRFLTDAACQPAIEQYYELHRAMDANGFICGRITMEESFTGGFRPELEAYPPAEYTHFTPTVNDAYFAIAIDPKGLLGWKSNRICDDDPGYNGARIVELVTRTADPRYLSYLRRLEIPYLVTGKDRIDLQEALCLLQRFYGIKNLLLEGGSITNSLFMDSGVVDALSLVVAPVTGNKGDKPLFDSDQRDAFVLEKATAEKGVVHLQYQIKKQ